jgi:NAD(P)H-dependent FMN reductase
MKVLAFAASNSLNSINRQLAAYVAQMVEGANVELLDINNYELPIFSEQREIKLGQPGKAQQFYGKIDRADALVVSFAEHNGTYTAAWKNLLDWVSRIDRAVFRNKPALFLSASPGAGGASSVLKTAVASAPHFGADLVANLAVPNFHDNFDPYRGRISNRHIERQLTWAARKLAAAAAGAMIMERNQGSRSERLLPSMLPLSLPSASR